MANEPVAMRPSAGTVQLDTMAGSVSLGIFIFAALLEILFISVALFIVSTIPPGGDQTFPFETRVGMALFFGQMLHTAGLVTAISGMLGKTRRKRLAILGFVTNSLLVLLFWIG